MMTLSSTLRLRSPLVVRCIEDYRAGRRYPLDILRDVESLDSQQ